MMSEPSIATNLPTSGYHDRIFVFMAWLVTCVVLFTNLGFAPLTDLDEGAFSEATREMLARGDYVSPWLLDVPRFDKPALFHWLQMGAFSLTELSSYGARLPSALMGLIWVGGIGGWAYLIASRLSPASRIRTYGWAVLMAGTSLGIPAMSRAATADASLNAFMVLTLLFTWRALWPVSERESGRLWIRLAAVLVGLGLLAKGPIAILVPGAGSLIGAIGCGRLTLHRWLRLAVDPVAWAIVLFMAAPWYLLQIQAQGMAFIEGFLGLHNMGRFTHTMHGFSAGPLYYPIWILIATMPWSVPTVLTLVSAAGKSPVSRLITAPECRMAWAVFGFVVVFFSFSATKLPHYGFYGLSGFIVLVSLWLACSQPQRRRAFQHAMLASLFLFSIFLIISAQWLDHVVPFIRDPYYVMVLLDAAKELQSKLLVFAALACLSVAGLLMGLRSFRAGIVILSLAGTLAVYGLIVPTVMQSLRGPIWDMGLLIRGAESNQFTRVITWRLTAPSLSFAARRVIPAADPQPGDWVALPTHLISDLESQYSLASQVLFEKTGISLISVEKKP